MFEPDKYYRFSPFCSWIATSGIMNQCEECKCFWILDVVASYVPQLAKADYLKIIEVKLNKASGDGEGQGALFTVHDEINGELVRQEIQFTDLEKDVKWWAITDDEHTVILLPEEY